eukprot:7001345-Prymnesium_polylepis.1
MCVRVSDVDCMIVDSALGLAQHVRVVCCVHGRVILSVSVVCGGTQDRVIHHRDRRQRHEDTRHTVVSPQKAPRLRPPRTATVRVAAES